MAPAYEVRGRRPAPDEGPGLRVQLVEIAVLARLPDYLRVHPSNSLVAHGLPPRAVVVPQLVGSRLESPDPLAGRHVERQDGGRPEVGSRIARAGVRVLVVGVHERETVR